MANRPVFAQKAFDHSITDFALHGKHEAIACVDCHKQRPEIASKGLAEFNWAGLKKDCPLSSQELVVLRFVGQGMSSQKTADNLFISKHTVDTHRRNILKKLNVENTVVAYQRARDLGFLL